MTDDDNESEELVVSVYGGPDSNKELVLGRTEALVIRVDNAFYGPEDLNFKFVADKEDIWILRVAVSTPRILAWTNVKEIELFVDGQLPFLLPKGCSVTIKFPKILLDVKHT